MTPERIEEIKRRYNEVKPFSLWGLYVSELLAALEEAERQLKIEKIEGDMARHDHQTYLTETIKLSEERHNLIDEVDDLKDQLAEAQQTIARQREALESARSTMEDALSVGEARYKDFDTQLCPWADLTDGVESIEAVLGNKEGE